MAISENQINSLLDALIEKSRVKSIVWDKSAILEKFQSRIDNFVILLGEDAMAKILGDPGSTCITLTAKKLDGMTDIFNLTTSPHTGLGQSDYIMAAPITSKKMATLFDIVSDRTDEFSALLNAVKKK